MIMNPAKEIAYWKGLTRKESGGYQNLSWRIQMQVSARILYQTKNNAEVENRGKNQVKRDRSTSSIEVIVTI